jgi:hypothetical protein
MTKEFYAEYLKKENSKKKQVNLFWAFSSICAEFISNSKSYFWKYVHVQTSIVTLGATLFIFIFIQW